MKLGLTARVVAASTLVASVVGATFALHIAANASERASERIANSSLPALVAAGRLERVVIDLETSIRGYLLTRDESLLQPWDAAVASYPTRAQDWLDQVDEPEQRARAITLTNNIYSYVNQYSVPLMDRAQHGDPTASSTEDTRRGADRVNEIRRQFTDYESAETAIRAQELSRARDASQRAVVVATVGVVVSIVIVVGNGAYLVSMVRPVRRAAALAGRVADGDLSARMPETGAAEMGALETSFNTMAASLEASRTGLRDLAEEQSALRRVATLVAEGVAPARVFEAVTSEISGLLDADVALLVRYETDELSTVVASVPSIAATAESEQAPGGGFTDVAAMARESGRVVTVQADALGTAVAADLRARELRSATAVPVRVENRLWGAVLLAWREQRVETTEVESKVAGFTELVATALATAQSRADLEASRARVVAASDETRRRIERDLHDGTQQRLVALGLELRTLDGLLRPGSPELDRRLARIGEGISAAVAELQEVSRGLHPALLSRGGVGPALRVLARRSALPVELDLHLDREPPEPVAVAVYYVLSEALANAAKHARPSRVDVRVVGTDQQVELTISDDGSGGADSGRGSGLIGLRDRVEALRGCFDVTSPAGEGTTVHATIPVPRTASGKDPAAPRGHTQRQV
jgi:signal transduction histidine kinase